MQLPLAHSGWLFKEESEEPDVKPLPAGPKEEDMEVDVPAVKGTCVSRLPFLPPKLSPEALTGPPAAAQQCVLSPPTQKYRHRVKT